MPNETLRIAGIASVRTRRPLGSTVRRTVPPSGSSLSVRVTARAAPPERPTPVSRDAATPRRSGGNGALKARLT
ncbi:hypothetical protein GCM10011576_59560 [Micromonospora parathelypteridis]|nr:hypothetical protein GCM10011576_59560 [Micromonospora parathelypteridis]